MQINFLSPKKISKLVNPFYAWGFNGIAIKKIAQVIIGTGQATYRLNAKTLCEHAENIAFFAMGGEGSDLPIEFDGGIPGFDSRPYIEDGNHRLAAALLRNDKSIAVKYSGSMDLLKKLKSSSFSIEEEILKSMDNSMKNAKIGKTSKPVDMIKLKTYL